PKRGRASAPFYAATEFACRSCDGRHREHANNLVHSQYFHLQARHPLRLTVCPLVISAPFHPVATSAARQSATAHRRVGKSIHALPVAIVDDDVNDQLLLKRLLDQMTGFVCVGCFSSGEAAIAGIARSGARLVLMDLRLPGMSDLECARRLKAAAPGMKIIAITGYASETNLNEALYLEFSGFLTKPVSRRELADALKVAWDGGIYLSAGLWRFFQERSPGVASVLTTREREVLQLLARGLEYKEIADRLKISPSTVNNHLAHIREKLGVHNAIEAINKMFPRPE